VLSVEIVNHLNDGGVVAGDILCATLFVEGEMYGPVPLCERGLVSKGCNPEAMVVIVGGSCHHVEIQ
jgi:hypothetical protein